MGVQIRRWTGTSGSETKTDITGINTRLNAEDAHTTAGTSNPIVVPTSGTNYSFWAVTRLFYSGSGTGTINNVKWYTDGVNGLGTGVSLKMQAASGYVQATGTAGTTGSVLNTTNYATLSGAPVDAFTKTSGSPLSVSGSATNPNNSEISDFVVLQVEVGTTASQGATPTESMTWQYDSTIP